MNALAKVVAAFALDCILWTVYSHERSVHPPDGVLVENFPRQHNYVDDQPPIRHGEYTLIPRAHYDITGRVLMHVFYSDEWSDLSPLDLSLRWQEMSDSAFLAGLTITETRRTLLVDSTDHSLKDYYGVQTRSSNNHLIPEDRAIESALNSLRVGEVVELEGELVDATGPRGFEAHTSMVRNDVGDACEIFLVRQVKLKFD